MKLRGALPPGFLIQLVQGGWTWVWQLMMGQLAPRNDAGDYVRPDSQFRHWVGVNDREFIPEPGRYQLIVGLGCPWAQRTLIVRAIKGLEETIPVIWVSPSPQAGGWVFETSFLGCHRLVQLYQLSQPNYGGRSTVPVLWDSHKQCIVNNESADIIQILNDEFNHLAQSPEIDLYPLALRPEIDRWNQRIYLAVNNGVYRCGFAQTQLAYDQACQELFTLLGELDDWLATHRFLCGDTLTLADVRIFPTLFRFDAVYYTLFKCNWRRIQDYKYLGAYLRDLYQWPGIAETGNLEVVKQEYYGNLFPLNPGGIIPRGPDSAFWQQPHGRDAQVSCKAELKI